MIRALLEVYSDDLIIFSSQTTATGLSKVLENCCDLGKETSDELEGILIDKFLDIFTVG